MINYVTNSKKLYCRYAGQINRQDIYIELNFLTGEISVSYNSEIGNAVPINVYNGSIIRIVVPHLTTKSFNEVLDEISIHFANALVGFDGTNFSSKAIAEIEKIEEILSEDNLSNYDFMEYFDCYNYINSDYYTENSNVNLEIEKVLNSISENVIVEGDIEEYISGIIFTKRTKFLLDYFESHNIEEFLDISSNGIQNPVMYFLNYTEFNTAGGVPIFTLFFDDSGRLIHKFTELINDKPSITYASVGRAICTKYFHDKYSYSTLKEKFLNAEMKQPNREKVISCANRTFRANNYDAAMCEAVPEFLRYTCKKIAEKELLSNFKTNHKEYFDQLENIEIKGKMISDIENEILKLQNTKKEIENEIINQKSEIKKPSCSTDKDACRFKNLTGKFPSLK